MDSTSARAAQAVQTWCASQGLSDLDDTIIEYVAGVLIADEEGSELEELSELLVASSPMYAACEPAQRLPQLLVLFQQVRAADQALATNLSAPQPLRPQCWNDGVPLHSHESHIMASSSVSSGGLLDTGAVRCTAVDAQITGRCQMSNAHLSSSGNSSSSSSRQHATAQPDVHVHDQGSEASIDQMYELCSGVVSRDFLRHVLSRHHWDLGAAAEWVLGEDEQLVRREVAWRASLERVEVQEAAAELEAAKSRKQLLERFDLQAVPFACVSKKHAPRDLAAWPGGPGSVRDGKVRYRDGAVVTSKGDKFVVEKQEEWDGGSKGKVYTKGKRGKGFV